ncbi:hypothetical protein [Paraconexibacter algicola]|uniref:Uncharacterized protein n=1 Tax=Paraconexibacter algicola TaxID=2133960 RepID=A0A2T4UKP5_9ACTN|nr:hypothetical protein [Paraconexibacter algicola]PTL59813.1 hypothetical protein C7Y72_09195 [Paraconexibacter algicola]
MDASQLSTGAKVAGGAGLALLIIMFLPWYEVSASFGNISASDSGNAWQVFSFIDIVLFITGVVAVGVAVAAAQNKLGALPVPAGQLVLGLGALATLLVLFRILSVPDGDIPDGLDDGIDIGRKIGVFLGFFASAAIAYAGTLLAKK